MQVALIAESVTPREGSCAGPDLVGGGGCSYMFLVQSTPTCTEAGLDHCNLHWWCFSFHQVAQIPYLHVVMITHCTLHR